MANQKEQKEKPTRLTKKQKKFVNAFIDPDVDTIAEAARIAGYCDRQTGYETLQKPSVQGALQSFLETLEIHGATDSVVAQRIADGLHATVVKRFAHEGKVISTCEDIDHPTRHKFIETVLKTKQIVSGGSKEPTVDNRKQLVIVIGSNGKTGKEVMEDFI